MAMCTCNIWCILLSGICWSMLNVGKFLGGLKLRWAKNWRQWKHNYKCQCSALAEFLHSVVKKITSWVSCNSIECHIMLKKFNPTVKCLNNKLPYLLCAFVCTETVLCLFKLSLWTVFYCVTKWNNSSQYYCWPWCKATEQILCPRNVKVGLLWRWTLQVCVNYCLTRSALVMHM